MTTETRPATARTTIVLASLLGVIVFGITQISYWMVEQNAPARYVPAGFVALAMDIFSYYSFIWQAADGHWIFNNGMTSEPCERIFLNLQWLALGKCMAWFAWSPQFTFILWRFLGAVTLLLGFAVLAIQILPRTSQRIMALLMCTFGGGFGWFIAALGTFGVLDTSDRLGLKNPAMDLITAVHPFGQILKNPHYSLPHGTFLLFVAAFVQGERTLKTRWYAVAAAIAVIQGLIRPYDVITVCALIPAFICVEALRGRSLTPRVAARRALPFLACLPLLAYFYYLFSVHSIFKWWAIQGRQLPTPATWHTIALGLAGLLFVYRLLQYKKVPLADPGIRFLVVLAATILVLYHGNHLADALSFSPQIGIPLMAPLILVGLGAMPYIRERWFGNSPNVWAASLCLFVVVNSLSSPLFILWSARIGQGTSRNYTPRTELDAMDWLKRNSERSDMILSNDEVGGRISFSVGARVALGHWALTPHVKALKKRFARFESGDMSPRKARQFVAEIAPRYVFIEGKPGSQRPRYLRRNSDLYLVYANADVSIYELRPHIALAR